MHFTNSRLEDLDPVPSTWIGATYKNNSRRKRFIFMILIYYIYQKTKRQGENVKNSSSVAWL
jgi:hypothetical protein